MVAYLKVSIALKSELHYDACLDAKRLELSDEFKAKLGWLVGELYSRVGTTDWLSKMTDLERKKMIKENISSRIILGSKESLLKLKEYISEGDSEEDVRRILNSIHIKSKYDEVMEIVCDIIDRNCKQLDIQAKERLKNDIRSRQKLKSLILG